MCQALFRLTEETLEHSLFSLRRVSILNGADRMALCLRVKEMKIIRKTKPIKLIWGCAGLFPSLQALGTKVLNTWKLFCSGEEYGCCSSSTYQLVTYISKPQFLPLYDGDKYLLHRVGTKPSKRMHSIWNM